MPDIIIEIPDPSMQQPRGRPVNFIENIPPELSGLEVRIDEDIMKNIAKHPAVFEYIFKLRSAALASGLQIKESLDVKCRRFIYTFQNLKGGNDTLESVETRAGHEPHKFNTHRRK